MNFKLVVSFKAIAILCFAGALVACSTPAPEASTVTPAPTQAATFTPSLVPSTETPSPTPQPTATPVPHLAIVLARGEVNCGVDTTRLDYTADAPNFDVDICRALAAALFDDPDAYRLIPIEESAEQPDVYFGSLDALTADLHTGPALFVDATGAIARTDVGIRQIGDLKFATVCLIQDSADERQFDQAAAAARVTVQPFLFNATDLDAMYAAYDQGRCDAIVDDRVRLALRLPAFSASRDQDLIDLALPKGTRGLIAPATDANWIEIVDAVSAALVQAEALGVDSANLDASLASDDPAIRFLLGVDGDAGSRIGLSDDFAARIVRHIGNYAEVYARHYPNLPRGPNALSQEGGLIPSP